MGPLPVKFTLPMEALRKHLHIYAPADERSAFDWASDEAAAIKIGDVYTIFKPNRLFAQNESMSELELAGVAFVFRKDAGEPMNYYIDDKNFEMSFMDGVLSTLASEAREQEQTFYCFHSFLTKPPNPEQSSALAGLNKWGGAGERNNCPKDLPDPLYQFLKSLDVNIDDSLAKDSLPVADFVLALLNAQCLAPDSKAPKLEGLFTLSEGTGVEFLLPPVADSETAANSPAENKSSSSELSLSSLLDDLVSTPNPAPVKSNGDHSAKDTAAPAGQSSASQQEEGKLSELLEKVAASQTPSPPATEQATAPEPVSTAPVPAPLEAPAVTSSDPFASLPSLLDSGTDPFATPATAPAAAAPAPAAPAPASPAQAPAPAAPAPASPAQAPAPAAPEPASAAPLPSGSPKQEEALELSSLESALKDLVGSEAPVQKPSPKSSGPIGRGQLGPQFNDSDDAWDMLKPKSKDEAPAIPSPAAEAEDFSSLLAKELNSEITLNLPGSEAPPSTNTRGMEPWPSDFAAALKAELQDTKESVETQVPGKSESVGAEKTSPAAPTQQNKIESAPDGLDFGAALAAALNAEVSLDLPGADPNSTMEPWPSDFAAAMKSELGGAETPAKPSVLPASAGSDISDLLTANKPQTSPTPAASGLDTISSLLAGPDPVLSPLPLSSSPASAAQSAAAQASSTQSLPAQSTPTAAAESPTTQTPVAQAPAAQAPVAQTPAAQTPAAQAPVAQAPVAQAPAAQAPVAQTPAAQAPVAQAPAAQAPVAQAPAAQVPVAQAPVAQAPVAQAPVAQAPIAPDKQEPLITSNADAIADLLLGNTRIGPPQPAETTESEPAKVEPQSTETKDAIANLFKIDTPAAPAAAQATTAESALVTTDQPNSAVTAEPKADPIGDLLAAGLSAFNTPTEAPTASTTEAPTASTTEAPPQALENANAIADLLLAGADAFNSIATPNSQPAQAEAKTSIPSTTATPITNADSIADLLLAGANSFNAPVLSTQANAITQTEATEVASAPDSSIEATASSHKTSIEEAAKTATPSNLPPLPAETKSPQPMDAITSLLSTNQSPATGSNDIGTGSGFVDAGFGNDLIGDLLLSGGLIETGTDATLAPATPDAALAPATPDAALAPATPDAALAPATPDAALAPATPDANPAPATPDAALAPATPDANPAPATPDANPAPATSALASETATKTAADDDDDDESKPQKKLSLQQTLAKLEDQSARANSRLAEFKKAHETACNADQLAITQKVESSLKHIDDKLSESRNQIIERLKASADQSRSAIKAVVAEGTEKIQSSLPQVISELERVVLQVDLKTVGNELTEMSEKFRLRCQDRMSKMQEEQNLSLATVIKEESNKLHAWRSGPLNDYIQSVEQILGRVEQHRIASLSALESSLHSMSEEMNRLKEIDLKRLALLSSRLSEDLEQSCRMTELRLTRDCDRALAEQILPLLAEWKSKLVAKSRVLRSEMEENLESNSKGSLSEFEPVMKLAEDAVALVISNLNDLKKRVEKDEKKALDKMLVSTNNHFDNLYKQLCDSLEKKKVSETDVAADEESQAVKQVQELGKSYENKLKEECSGIDDQLSKLSEAGLLAFESRKLDIIERSQGELNASLEAVKAHRRESLRKLQEKINKLSSTVQAIQSQLIQ